MKHEKMLEVLPIADILLDWANGEINHDKAVELAVQMQRNLIEFERNEILSKAVASAGENPSEENETITINNHPFLSKEIHYTDDVPVRVYNCLRLAQLKTYGDVFNYGFKELRRIRNFGVKSLTKLEHLFERNGIDLRKKQLITIYKGGK